jgi:hypothetical protein
MEQTKPSKLYHESQNLPILKEHLKQNDIIDEIKDRSRDFRDNMDNIYDKLSKNDDILSKILTACSSLEKSIVDIKLKLAQFEVADDNEGDDEGDASNGIDIEDVEIADSDQDDVEKNEDLLEPDDTLGEKEEEDSGVDDEGDMVEKFVDSDEDI